MLPELVRFVHHADKAIELDRAREYAHDRSFPFKPTGLWLSVPGDDSWESWCRGEGFAIDRLAVEHRVVLHSSANILWIATEDGLAEFHNEYSMDDDFRNGLGGVACKYGIDWHTVAEKYDGIVIVPHMYRMRWSVNFLWYSTWDVASACIWNLDAINVFEAMETNVSAE